MFAAEEAADLTCAFANGGEWSVTASGWRYALRLDSSCNVEVSPEPNWSEMAAIQVPRYLLLLPRSLSSPELWADMVANWTGWPILDGLHRPCTYLPASRTGLFQGRKEIASSLLRSAGYAGPGRAKPPRPPLAVTDFIAGLLEIEPRRLGPYADLADQLATELLHGAIVPTKTDGPYRDYVLMQEGLAVRLDRASSSVSELAPLILYVRHRLPKDGLLIIEEPEAHLHPQLQRVLARMLVRMVNAGIHLLITTHSEFLLAQLNNLIRLQSLSPERRAGFDVPDTDLIAPEDVGAYVFQPAAAAPGAFEIVELPVDPREGISEESFSRVDEALYEQACELVIRQDEQGG